MSQIYFFAKDTYTANVNHWIDIIKRGESGSILDYSRRGQVYRIDEFLDDHQTLAKHFSGKNATSFTKCNLDNFLLSDVKALEIFLNASITQNNRSVIFVMNADILITEKTEWLAYLNAYVVAHPNLSMLFFFKKNITAPFYLKKLAHFSVLFQNIVIKRPYTLKDVREFMNEVQKVFGVEMPEEVSQKILSQCKNKLWLVKEAVRYYAKTADEEHIFDHDEMILRIQAVLNELDPWEYEVVQKVGRQNFNFTEEEKAVVQYLMKTQFVEQIGEGFMISVPLIRHYIKQQQQRSAQIFLDTKQNILVNNVNVNQMFSRTEREMFRFLLQNQNTLITREKLAQAIWKGEYYEKYSDWALDQTVKRFREKVAKLGLQKSMLQTKKNQGFIFSCNL